MKPGLKNLLQKLCLLLSVIVIAATGMAQTKTPAMDAKEAAIWGIPIVSMDAMRQAYFRDAQARYNDIVFWSQPADWKNQTTTPNSSSFYVYFNFKTKNLPFVLEMPEAKDVGVFGVLMTAWQKPLTEVGPAGADQGKGGKYLILPPGYKGQIPKGYFVFRSETYNGYALLCFTAITNSDADMNRARDLVKSLKAYDLSKTRKTPKQNYIDMVGKEFNGLVAFDRTFYATLAKMINEEPVMSIDKERMKQLASLGIAKGATFSPTSEQMRLYETGIREAHTHFKQAMVDGVEPFAQGSRWGLGKEALAGKATQFSFITNNELDYRSRGFTFFLAYAVPQRLGEASFYLANVKDSEGQPFTGEQNYHLRIPANVPAKYYWAVNVYDLDTAAFIRNSPSVGIDSYSKAMTRNSDGTVDVYFGPKAPVGKEANWIYTQSGKPWFAFFRLYGPGKEVFDKKWILPDVEKVPSMKQAGADALR